MSVSLAFPRATGISQFAPSTKRFQSRTGNFHCRRDDYGGRIRAKLLLPAAPPTHLPPPPPVLPLKPSPAPIIPTPSRKETTTGDDEDIRRDVGGKLMAWTSIKQERWEGELEVQGEIPSWLHGIYLRNGPGKWNIEDYNFRHLFDGYATLIKLHFHPNKKVTGAHRQIESDAYKSAMANKKVCYREFSESPPKPNNNNSNKAAALISYYFQQLTGLLSGSSLTDNPNTGVIQLGDGRVVCLTETQKGSIVIDPETLDTVGRFEYDDGLGSGMYLLHSAHPIVTESEFLTLVPDLVRPGYVVARMTLHEKKNSNNNNKRKVVGRVECRGGPGPGWVHSFAVTENYIIVPEMPLRYSAGNLLREIPTPLYKFGWHPESKAFMHVMCRKTGKLVASVEVPLFVTFHFINAYEKKDVDGRVTAIIADCCEHYADPGILDKLKLHNLRNFNGQDVLPDARVGRFTIPMDGSPYGSLEPALDPNQHGRGMDMCSINPSFLGKNYRYAYACGARRPCNFPNTITKIDLVNKTAKSWHEEGAIPSEPFFVARPGAEKEDDGVVISLVSDRNGEGYAVLLDASNFKEIARAKFPYGLPYGLHGCWIPL